MSENRKRCLALMSAVLLLLGGCASHGDDEPVPGLSSVRWELVSWSEHEVPNGDNGEPVVLTFHEGESADVSGRSWCNQFHAPYVLRDGQRLTIGHAAATRMMCSGKAMDFEEAFLDKLQALVSYQIHGQTLELRAMDGQVMRLRARDTLSPP